MKCKHLAYIYTNITKYCLTVLFEYYYFPTKTLLFLNRNFLVLPRIPGETKNKGLKFLVWFWILVLTIWTLLGSCMVFEIKFQSYYNSNIIYVCDAHLSNQMNISIYQQLFLRLISLRNKYV